MEELRKNLWKKALIAIIATSLIFGGSIPAYAVEVAENYTDVGTLKIKKIAEDNDFLTLAVELDNNPGISTLELELSYDGSAFSLTEVGDKQILFFGSEEGSFIKSENLNANPQYCMWRKTEGNTINNGELVSFKFSKVSVQESGEYSFTLQNVVGGYLDESQASAQTIYRQFNIGGYTYRMAQTKTGAALAR